MLLAMGSEITIEILPPKCIVQIFRALLVLKAPNSAVLVDLAFHKKPYSVLSIKRLRSCLVKRCRLSVVLFKTIKILWDSETIRYEDLYKIHLNLF